MSKKQKIIVGDIVKVKIDESNHTYARVLNHSDLAFYDAITNEDEENINQIISQPILFKAIVNARGVEGGVWPTVGNVPLDEDLKKSKYYLTDVTDPNHFRISENGIVREATKKECLGLEVGAVWDPMHIQQRLKDYYAGQENNFLKFLDTLGNYKLG